MVLSFTAETAHKKVKTAQDLWNTKYAVQKPLPPLAHIYRDPARVFKAYTEQSIWRNRDQFFTGHAEIIKFLTAKWDRELDYHLRKELFSFTDNKIAVQFWYEYRNRDDGLWYRCYGLEDWTFAEDGRMRKRMMSGNDVRIGEDERWFKDGVDVNTVEISERHW